MKWDEVNNWRLALHREFEEAFRLTRLSDEQTARAALNDLLVRVRLRTVGVERATATEVSKDRGMTL